MRIGILLAALAASAMAQNKGQSAAALEQRAERLFEDQRWKDAAGAAEAAVRADPTRVNAHVILGLIATREGRGAAASSHFAKAADLRPDDVRITGYLASAYFQQGRARDAEPLFRRVVAADPGNEAAHFNLGLLLLQRGAAREAEAQFQVLASADPSDIGAAAGILECRFIQKNRAAAAESARQINVRLLPSDPERLRIASLLAKYEAWDLAISLLDPVPVGLPYGLEARYDLALAHFRAGAPEAAAKVLAETPALLQQADAQHLVGNIEEKLGHLEAARKALDRAATLAPRSEDILFDQAVFQLEHGDPAAAIAAFRAGVNAFPDSWRMRLGLADAQYLAGSAGEAVGTLLELVQKHPDVRLAYPLLGSLYEQVPATEQERIYEAVKSYANGGSRDARTYTAFAKILNVRAKTTGKPDERAVPLLQRAIAIDPKLMEAYLELAAIESDRGQLQQSRELLDKAASLSPAAPEPHYRLARLYRKLGRNQDAAAESETFRKLQQNATGHHVTSVIDLKKQPRDSEQNQR